MYRSQFPKIMPPLKTRLKSENQWKLEIEEWCKPDKQLLRSTRTNGWRMTLFNVRNKSDLAFWKKRILTGKCTEIYTPKFLPKQTRKFILTLECAWMYVPVKGSYADCTMSRCSHQLQPDRFPWHRLKSSKPTTPLPTPNTQRLQWKRMIQSASWVPGAVPMVLHRHSLHGWVGWDQEKVKAVVSVVQR